MSRKDDTGEDQGSGGGIPTAGAECVGISRAERSWVFPLRPDGEEWRVHVFPAQNGQQCPHPGHWGEGSRSGAVGVGGGGNDKSPLPAAGAFEVPGERERR